MVGPERVDPQRVTRREKFGDVGLAGHGSRDGAA